LRYCLVRARLRNMAARTTATVATTATISSEAVPGLLVASLAGVD